MCHIVRGKYVPVAGARNTLPVASEDGTGSRKAAETVLRRKQLNTEFPPSSRALSLQELIGERLLHTSPICLFHPPFGRDPCPQLDISQWEPKVKWQGG